MRLARRLGHLCLLALGLAGCYPLAPPRLELGRPLRVPTNQTLTPFGLNAEFPGRPVDLAFSPDGRELAVLADRAVLFLDPATGAVRHSIAARGKNGFSFAGILFREGRVYASSLAGRIEVLERAKAGWKAAEPIPLSAKPAVPGGLALSTDGARLYVAMNAQDELWEVDAAKRSVLRKFAVGVAPYAVALAGGKAYVSCWGGRRPGVGDIAAPAGIGVVRVDPVRQIACEGSVSVLDLATGATLREIPVGPHAAGLALSPDGARLAVACANADEVVLLDTRKDELALRVNVRPRDDLLLGSSPNAVAFSPDGSLLLVSNGTNNAVGVFELPPPAGDASKPAPAAGPAAAPPAPAARALGFVPVAWYPAGLAFDPKGERLAVANVKGVGSVERKRKRGANSHDYRGSVSLFEVPERETLAALTRQVQENNRLGRALAAIEPARRDVPPRPVPERQGEPSPIEHVVYIIKENRTYDQVLGDMPEGDGDPKLCEFGEKVTPNHHALAREFVLLDRFSCCGVLSADGHQWTDEAFVTDYLEKFFGGWVRSYPFAGGDALAYSGGGFLWDNALAHGKSLRVYGEFTEAKLSFTDGTKGVPTFQDCQDDYRSGAGRVRIRGVARIKSLEPYLCPTTIGFPLNVTDQYRADQFLKELAGFEEKGGFPNLSILLLPGDHTAGTKPGFPTPRACVADNDLALGRIIEGLSKSRFWKRTCVFVVEDDPQAGLDHVDGHRTVALVAGPHVRRAALVHAEYNQTSLVRTIELILGLPPMNQMDAAATPMRECFREDADADATPYAVRPATSPLDERNARLEDIRDPQQRFWAERSTELALDEVDEADEATLNRILWHATKGYGVPYPEQYARAGEGGDGEDDEDD